MSRLLPRDLLRLATVGLRTRKLRAALSVLGISIGIASLVAVLAISETSKGDLLAKIETLGTNLLTVAPGESLFGEETRLPAAAAGRIRLLDDVESAAAVTAVDGATVRRSSYVPANITGGIFVAAADPQLLATLEGSTASGRFLDRASERYPAIVLGAKAAQRLGIRRVRGLVQVFVAGRLFTVVGILDPLPLAAELDSAALIGYPVAKRLFGTDRSPSEVYVRARDGEARVRAAAALLPRAADPWAPGEVAVSRPSDALEAQAAAEGAFTSLFLGLGAVALLVGAIGIANVMIISVLERRPEVGLRRALGARRRHIAVQFLGESFVLGTLGGVVGVLLGVAATGAFAAYEGLPLLVPSIAIAGGLLAACLLGAVAGLYPGDARRPPHPDRGAADDVTTYRRRSPLRPMTIAAVVIVLLAVAWLRVGGQAGDGASGGDPKPPASQRVERTADAGDHAHGPALHLDWPDEGQAAVAIPGRGTFTGPDGETPVPIASVAKVMTAYLVLKEDPLDPGEEGFTFTIGPADVDEFHQRLESNQSVLAVEAGEVLSEREALEALLLPSANNVAALLAVHEAGSVEAFVAEMNEAAAELGMGETEYTDPSGFEDTTVSTAADQLKLGRAAMADPTFREIVALPAAVLPVAGEVANFNELVGREGYVGIKTGSDDAAGGCLLFARRVRLGGRTRTMLGAVLGQRDGDLIPAALTATEALADSAAAALRR